MTYIVIDEDGELHLYDAAPTIDLVTEHVGPEGWNKVRLAREYGAVGWANDCGLVLHKYRRNVAASCVLATMQAPQQPYAGPIVITGYAHDEGGWPENLPEQVVEGIRDIHHAVRQVIAGEQPTSRAGRSAAWATRQWARDIAGFADEVRVGPTPGITFRRGER